MTMLQSFDIVFVDRRCVKCGKYWYCEQHQDGSCPYCRHDEVSLVWRENATLRRVNAALRGALKRANRKA